VPDQKEQMTARQGEQDHASRLHQESVVVDFHCDAVLATLPDSAYNVGSQEKVRKLAERSSEGHVDVPRLLEGGVDCQVFSHFVEPIYNPVAPSRMLQVLGHSLTEIKKCDQLDLVTDVEQIYRNKGDKISIVIGFEGGEALGEDLRRLEVFYRLGLRRLTLTWNNRNALADGVKWQMSGGGLTEFGTAVVRECNRLGILVDVSHITDAGFWDTLEASEEPVIASHSNCRALCGAMRNLTDEMIKALAAKGGVIGVNYASFFLADMDREKLDGGDEAELQKAREVTVDTVIDHIDHIVEVVGDVDHVGLGSDFDGVALVAVGLEDTSRLPNLTRGLLQRGYSDQDISKILGGNWLRVMKEVW